MTDHSGEFLKCDTPSCDHFEHAPIIVENIGKACPKCSASLLTKEDFVTFRAVLAATRAATEVAQATDPDVPMVLMATHVHGGNVQRKRVDTIGPNPFPNTEQQESK